MGRSAWGLRVILAVCVVVSGVVHYARWSTGMRYVDIVGPAFLINAVAGVVIGALLLVWRHWIPLFLALGFGAATLGAFIVATSPLGLFGVHSRWQGAAEWTCAVTEAIALVLGVIALIAERERAAAVRA